jgi:hypothetical protein
LLHFEPDLVLEVFWVVEGGFVEDEYVRERGEDVVDDESEKPAKLVLAIVNQWWAQERGNAPGDEEQCE